MKEQSKTSTGTAKEASVKQTAQQMIGFFQTYDAQEGVPSLDKFADTVGLDGEALRAQASVSPTLARAIRRCNTILCDRLRDGGLLKRYDPSFCKYLLDSLKDADQLGGDQDQTAFEVKIEIEGGRSPRKDT